MSYATRAGLSYTSDKRLNNLDKVQCSTIGFVISLILSELFTHFKGKHDFRNLKHLMFKIWKP